MQKQDWVNRISQVLAEGRIFVHKTTQPNKSAFLFAVDMFRRMNHVVHLSIEPSEHGKACLYVRILPQKGYHEFTLRRNDDPAAIIQAIAGQGQAMCVSIRGCGTVLDSLFEVMDWAIHNGWYVEKTFMSTLTQTLPNKSKQRNTAMNVVIQRGSNVDSI